MRNSAVVGTLPLKLTTLSCCECAMDVKLDHLINKWLYCKHSLVIDDVKLVDAQILVDEPSTGLLE